MSIAIVRLILALGLLLASCGPSRAEQTGVAADTEGVDAVESGAEESAAGGALTEEELRVGEEFIEAEEAEEAAIVEEAAAADASRSAEESADATTSAPAVTPTPSGPAPTGPTPPDPTAASDSGASGAPTAGGDLGALVPKEWLPPRPEALKSDWIQLKSGEWLRGDIERMRDDSLEFDSEELDDLKLDFDDISRVLSPKRHTFSFENHVIVRGPAVINRETVTILVAEEKRVFARRELVAIIPAAERERERWSGKLSVGVTARSGNTNQADLSASAWIRRETATTRFRTDYRGSYSQTDNEAIANTHRANSRLDWYQTRKFYVTPAFVEIFHDPFSNVSMRLTPGSSVGYFLFRGRFEWSVELGLAYQWTRFESVDVGENLEENNGAAIFGTEFELELTKRIDLDGSYTLQLTFPDLGNTNHNAYIELSVELTEYVDLDFSFNWDRIEDPRETASGEQPKSDDYRTVVSLGLDF